MMPPLHTQVLVVGAGPIGLAVAISARRSGFDPLVIDAGPIAHSIWKYPVGMVFFTTPERLEIGGHPLVCSGAKATREEALKYYRGVVRTEGLQVRPYTRLVSARRESTGLVATVQTAAGASEIRAERIVVATGYFDHPNLLGVVGEDLPHVSHYAAEPHAVAGLRVVIVGGKNSAIETALLYYRAGATVTLLYRGAVLKPSIKYWLRPDFENRVAAGEIAVRYGAEVTDITPTDIGLRRSDGSLERLPADRIFALTGYHPDFGLFARMGIRTDPETGRPDHDPDTLESNVPGVYLAGSVTAGRAISEVFIENGRYDGERIFGDAERKARALDRLASDRRPTGE